MKKQVYSEFFVGKKNPNFSVPYSRGESSKEAENKKKENLIRHSPPNYGYRHGRRYDHGYGYSDDYTSNRNLYGLNFNRQNTHATSFKIREDDTTSYACDQCFNISDPNTCKRKNEMVLFPGCNHVRNFCKLCFKRSIEFRLVNFPGQPIGCPTVTCDYILNEKDIFELLSYISP
jgi:hypothetical protein